jgi:hypothetical protein
MPHLEASKTAAQCRRFALWDIQSANSKNTVGFL